MRPPEPTEQRHRPGDPSVVPDGSEYAAGRRLRVVPRTEPPVVSPPVNVFACSTRPPVPGVSELVPGVAPTYSL